VGHGAAAQWLDRFGLYRWIRAFIQGPTNEPESRVGGRIRFGLSNDEPSYSVTCPASPKMLVF